MTATASSTTEASGERCPKGAPGVDLPDEVLAALGAGEHSGPHAFLGQHPVEGSPDGTVVIRALRPFAREVVAVLDGGARIELGHAGHGVWQGLGTAGAGAYAVEATYEGGEQWITDDQYRFLPSIGDVDLHLFGEGRHERLWEMLGAHVRVMAGQGEPVTGTSFAVWAPHASAVQVIADFNGWDGRLHAMRRMDANGVWELFVPGIGAGTTYKFRIRTAAGGWIEKADPFARLAEVPPRTASVVTESGYEWADAGWLEERTATEGQHAPMSIYEVHLGSWRPGLGYRELAEPLIEHVTSLGFTHVEFLPLAEHPFGGSWGYQVSGYYAPTSRFGSPDDLKFLIDRLHEAGIGVIVDWVPAHFPKDAFALALFDGQPLYEHSDPRLGEQQDWGTLVFNFGDSQVRNFLVANALYWLEEFHVDGLRVDAVASMLYLDYSREEWLPNKYGGRENLEAIAFLQEANATAYKLYPGIVMIAEESTSWGGVTRPTDVGGLGFGRKWNMGWMNDGLRYIAKDPLWRGEQHSQITFSFHYAFSENFLLPISHDEVVHGKGSLYGRMPGDEWQKRANVRVFLAHMWAHPGKQLLFMGQEFGQQTEWSEERGVDWHQLDWHGHRELMALTGRLNALYRSTPALYELDDEPDGFAWIDGGDTANSVLAYERRDRDGSPVVALINFSGAPIGPYRVGMPFGGEWREALNTDDVEFGGSGVSNGGVVTATEEGHHGRPASVELTLPPLGALWLVPVAAGAATTPPE